jgi:hypothetical protein
VGEEHTLRRETVEVRRADVFLPVGAQLRSHVFGDEPQDVRAVGAGSLGLGVGGTRDEHQDEDQRRHQSRNASGARAAL